MCIMLWIRIFTCGRNTFCFYPWYDPSQLTGWQKKSSVSICCLQTSLYLSFTDLALCIVYRLGSLSTIYRLGSIYCLQTWLYLSLTDLALSITHRLCSIYRPQTWLYHLQTWLYLLFQSRSAEQQYFASGQLYFCRSASNHDVTAWSRWYTCHVAIKGDHTMFGCKCVPTIISWYWSKPQGYNCFVISALIY